MWTRTDVPRGRQTTGHYVYFMFLLPIVLFCVGIKKEVTKNNDGEVDSNISLRSSEIKSSMSFLQDPLHA